MSFYSQKRFQSVAEPYPAEKWLAHYHAALPSYRRWFASEGELLLRPDEIESCRHTGEGRYPVSESNRRLDPGLCISFGHLRRGDEFKHHRVASIKRPSLQECRTALQTYMPELVPLWEHLIRITEANDDDARLLSFYCPAPNLSGCSQAAWTRYSPVLVRNYDYAPEYCEGRIMKSCWNSTQVIASTDCLWGVLDGMNEHGLSVSLSFGGKDIVGEGFGISIILRYLLEFCATVDEAATALCRIPSHMAYNVSLLDAFGQVRTVELSPFSNPNITYKPFAVNHQGDFALSNYAMFSRSHERQQFIINKLYDPLSSIESFVNAFEYSPLFASNYAQCFGTLYTAIYNPQLRAMEYRWPNRARMYQSFSFFEEYDLCVDL